MFLSSPKEQVSQPGSSCHSLNHSPSSCWDPSYYYFLAGLHWADCNGRCFQKEPVAATSAAGYSYWHPDPFLCHPVDFRPQVPSKAQTCPDWFLPLTFRLSRHSHFKVIFRVHLLLCQHKSIQEHKNDFSFSLSALILLNAEKPTGAWKK